MERTPLSEWLLAQGISTNEFSELVREKMGLTRLSSSTVSAWRAGDRTPNKAARKAIMELTGLSEQDLMATEKSE